jgi:hypothetical protein
VELATSSADLRRSRVSVTSPPRWRSSSPCPAVLYP